MADNPAQAVLTHQHYVTDVISDGVLETNIFLRELKARNKIKFNVHGTQVEHKVRYAKHTITNWGAMSEPDVAQPDLHKTATHAWGGLYGSYFIDEWDVLANAGAEALFSMQEEYLESLKEDMDEWIEDYCFANGLAESPRGLGGLTSFVAATGTYGGLSQADTYWKAQILSGASGTIVGGPFGSQEKVYLTNLTNLCVRGKARNKRNMPDAGFCNRNHWNAIHDNIESIRRVISNEEKLKLGHVNFVWDGVEYFWSDSATASKVYLVNFDMLELWCQTPKLTVPRSMKTQVPVGTVHQLLAKAQFVCRSPRHFGKLSATGLT